MKPFTVSKEWIDYAHGPGADDGQGLATKLVMLEPKGGSVRITEWALVDEVCDVAELYEGGTSVQEDDRLWFRMYPFKLVKRARRWLLGNMP